MSADTDGWVAVGFSSDKKMVNKQVQMNMNMKKELISAAVSQLTGANVNALQFYRFFKCLGMYSLGSIEQDCTPTHSPAGLNSHCVPDANALTSSHHITHCSILFVKPAARFTEYILYLLIVMPQCSLRLSGFFCDNIVAHLPNILQYLCVVSSCSCILSYTGENV